MSRTAFQRTVLSRCRLGARPQSEHYRVIDGAGVATLRTSDGIRLSARFRGWVEALSRQPALPRWSVAASVGLILVAEVAFWLLSSERLRAVSAEELLQRATQSEVAQIKQVAEPVVYRRIQMKRPSAKEAVTWESWREAGKTHVQQRGADAHGWRLPPTITHAMPP